MALFLTVFYTCAFLLAAAYGLRTLAATWIYLRVRDRADGPAPPAPPGTAVTVQLPIYNERLVARRAIDAVCRLCWTRGPLEIQVLDDSDDDTRELVDAAARLWRARGVDVAVLRRERRSGYKAGALAAGLETARGEAIAVFDADFLPPADFLERTVGFLGPGVAAVQARWGHLNDEDSGLTRAQAMALDGYFVVEQTARARGGLALNFNGSAGVWSRAAIAAAGGWRGDTVTEDVDLSYRAQLAGWRIVFLPEVEAPAELPATILAFQRQQRRWAKGTIQCARRLAGPVWRSDWPLGKRLHALASLTNHLVQPLMVAMLLLAPFLMLYHPSFHPLLALLTILSLNLPGMHMIAQRALYPDWARRMRSYPLLSVLAVGMTLNGSLAVWEGLTRDGGTFERTPKRGDADARASSAPSLSLEDAADVPRPGYRIAPSGQVLGELLLAAWAWLGLGLSILQGTWGSLLFLGTFAAGYSLVAGLSLAEAWRGSRAARRPSRTRTPV